MGGGTVRYIALALALGLAAEAASAARVVDPASARQAIENSAIVAVDAEISALAADNRATDLAARLDLIAHDRTITDVAQEWLLDRGLHALARLEPTSRSRETVQRLVSRTPIVYTRIDPDHGDRATPLYDTAATARFVLRNWDRNDARITAQADLAMARTAVVERFAGRAGHGEQDAVRAGIADAFRTATPAALSSQRAAIVEALTAGRRVDELALIVAEHLADAELFDLIFGLADEPVALAAVPAVPSALDAQTALGRLSLASRRADIASAAVLQIGRLAKGDTSARQFLFDALEPGDAGPSAAAALGALDDPAVAPELGRRLAKTRSEESRRLIVLALRLDASAAAQEELRRFAASKRGSAELQEETRQWLER
jgi:hypothetical protein